MSVSTERVRAHRRRKRTGMRLFKIRLCQAEIDELIDAGYLDHGERDDAAAITRAAETCIADAIAR
jgi:hypothetical protein